MEIGEECKIFGRFLIRVRGGHARLLTEGDGSFAHRGRYRQRRRRLQVSLDGQFAVRGDRDCLMTILFRRDSGCRLGRGRPALMVNQSISESALSLPRFGSSPRRFCQCSHYTAVIVRLSRLPDIPSGDDGRNSMTSKDAACSVVYSLPSTRIDLYCGVQNQRRRGDCGNVH